MDILENDDNQDMWHQAQLEEQEAMMQMLKDDPEYLNWLESLEEAKC